MHKIKWWILIILIKHYTMKFSNQNSVNIKWDAENSSNHFSKSNQSLELLFEVSPWPGWKLQNYLLIACLTTDLLMKPHMLKILNALLNKKFNLVYIL